MRYILRILLIINFFVLVFIPRSTIGVVNYWLLFVTLFIFALLFLYNEFYVTKKSVAKLLNHEIDFSISCEKVPMDETQNFLRGRLVVFNSMVLFYKKEKGKVILGWSKPLDEIDSIEFGKLSTKKKGFTLFSGEIKYEFANYIFKLDQEKLIKALDFEM